MASKDTPVAVPHKALTEKEKMLAGQLYDAFDPVLVDGRLKAREFMFVYSQLVVPSETNKQCRKELLQANFGSVGENVFVETPFFCDYAYNIHVGANTYMNFNTTILDCARVDIGRDVMFGPGVQIYTAHHPLQASERIKGPELASPIKIGDRCWIGGSVIICPGVTIGENSTIGAGSVVTRDIPPNSLAVGSPAKVIKQLKP